MSKAIQLNAVYQSYVALLAAEQDHERAMHALVKTLNGRRDPEVLEGLAFIITADVKDATFRVTFTKGQANIRFTVKDSDERHEGATKRWQRHIAAYLPKLKAGTAKKQDPVEALAATAKRKLSKAQLRRLVALLAE